MTNLFAQSASMLTLALLVAVFVIAARRLPMGAASLPCMMVLTSAAYFYLFPLMWIINGGISFFGLGFFDLTNVHLLVLLYCLGAVVPFFAFSRVFANHRGPNQYEDDIPRRPLVGYAVWALALGGMAYLISSGNFALLGAREGQTVGVSKLAFAYQSFTLLLPLTLMALIRSRFAPWAWLLAIGVFFILLQAGFRFRILILAVGIFSAYALMTKLRIREWQVLGGATGGLALMNIVGSVRRYGRGVDLSGVSSSNLITLASNFGGELGSVLATARIVNHPLPPLNYIEPWVVGIARFVPSFIWPNKPAANYLTQISAGIGGGAESAGIAPPQHIEMLFQLGWPGVFVLSALYFSLIMLLLGQINRLPLTPRIAGYSLLPIFFGYYMQSRGYLFQILADGLFVFGPLFLMSIKFNFKRLMVRRSGYFAQ